LQSKNKKAQTSAEREHVGRIKEMPCAVCDAPGPSDAHEIEQGLWWLSVPLCKDCHQGSHNGIHGRKAIWNVKRKTELSVLNEVIAEMNK
jgi:hypothetical protein